MWRLVVAVLMLLLAGGAPSTAASLSSTTAGAVEATSPPSRSARASARVETVSGDVGEAPRPTLSRAAVMAAARAAVAARAVEAARLAGAAGARLALAAAAPALRAGGGGGRGGGGGGSSSGPLVLGPVDNSSEPRCANVSSVHYSLDMLLGTWYVVEVISPVSVGTVCDGFELTKLNVSRAWEDLEAEAVIMSRFGRQPGGPTVYFNRTMLVGGGAGAPSDGQHEHSTAPMLYDQLAVTDYSPGGRYLSITACHEGQHWTYVYGRRPAPAAPDELRAMHARLAAAGVAVSAPDAPTTAPTADDAENDASGTVGRRQQAAAAATESAAQTQTSTARERTPPAWWPALPATPTPAPLPVFNVTECGW